MLVRVLKFDFMLTFIFVANKKTKAILVTGRGGH
jgi:hypothetical protein